MKECFDLIYKCVNENPDMSEPDLYEVLIDSRFFQTLGYTKIGKDVRVQRIVPGKRKKADYVCRDEFHNAIFVLEAKRPSHRTLSDALGQLWHRYVLPLKAKYGVLTNGWKILVYKRVRENPERMMSIDLNKGTQKQYDELFRILRKPEYERTLHSKVEEYFSSVEKLSLTTELAKENFFETFKLEEDSVFGSLLTSLYELFDFIHPKSRFLKGAYGFWLKSLARKPKKIPDSWQPFLKGERDVFRFMFCLETAHALLARLIVAKACEDLDFPGISISDFTIRKIHQVRGRIPIVAYPLVLIGVIREMRDQLVYSIFEDDIFGWWNDGFTDLMEKSSGELLRERVEKRLEDFSEAVAKVLFMLYKFDFGEVAGDPLGDLYQQYFDQDTRKALGEFYTPVEIVEYILDGVKYRNIGTRRLLDPSCGSGTFIVEALKRYLSESKGEAKKHGWAHVLRELCLSPRIVGFDIHPFACLIARTRFMLELIPYFKMAVEEAPHLFHLRRLPIFRTDSLAIEMTPPELKKQREIAETKGDIAFPVTLPMKIDRAGAISISIILPSWRKIVSAEMLLYNLDEYFCAFQAIFDVVKSVLKWAEEVPEKGLKAHLQEYLSNRNFERLASFFKPYADRILREVKRIQSEFEDGRLIKSIEDAILAALLKTYLEKQYHFVVGNPPYVRVQRLPAKIKESYRDSYDSASGKFDIYVLFIERGIDWLIEGGKLGYICSNQYMTRDYGKELRKLILKGSAIKQLLDFGDSGVFKEVTNYPCILVLQKGQKAENEITCVRVVKQVIDNKGQDVTITNIKENLNREQFSDESLDIFRIRQDKLTSKIWEIMPDSERRVFEKIRKNSTCLLGKLCKRIYEGIITGANEVYFVDQNDISQHSFDLDLLKPIPKGRNVKRWQIGWDGRYVIYPHEKVDSDVVPIDLGDYPRVENYLSIHRKRLEKRHYVLEAGKRWYEIWNPRDPTWFATPKIITPNLSTENSFAYDDGIRIRGKKRYYYLDHDCYGLALSSLKRSDHLFLLSLLNSKTLEFYLKHVSPFCAGKYFRYMTGYLKGLPIKIPQGDKEKGLSDQIVEKADKILFKSDPRRLVERFPESYLREYQVEGVEVDEIQHTINRDHDKLEPFLSGLPDKGYAVYPSEGEDFMWVNTKEKAQYLILALRDKKVGKDDIIKVLIPRDNSIVSEILERMKKTIRDLDASQISKLEEEIDEIVYQLYGLDDEDKVVINDFLEKF